MLVLISRPRYATREADVTTDILIVVTQACAFTSFPQRNMKGESFLDARHDAPL